MSEFDLPEDIRNFIGSFIRSVGHLEVLILLAVDPKRQWRPDEVSHELRTNPTYALAQLKELAQVNLLTVTDGKFSCNPDPRILDLVYKLQNAYNVKRSTVINFIYGQPLEKIRGLADAFKLKKD